MGHAAVESPRFLRRAALVIVRPMRASPAVALGAALIVAAANARAQEPAPAARRAADPVTVSGVDQPESEPGDFGRSVLDALLWGPRQVVDYAFIATDSAAGIVTNQQIVPRVEHLVNPRPGGIVVFPTAFAETGYAANVGARMIATGHNVTTTIRGGFGGVNEVVGETKIQIGRHHIFPTLISLEAYTDRHTDLEYFGVGQAPAIDPRNQYRIGPLVGLYRQERSRVITSYGFRPTRDVEVFASASIQRRTIDDVDAGDATLSRAFLAPSIPGALTTTTIAYGELAVRLDTRADAGKPSPGGLLEAYAGAATGLLQDDMRFLRFGGRAAAFIPIYRLTNILSPKIVFDTLDLRSGVVPFAELPGEPEFRGFDTRRDNISVTASLDYRYAFMKIFAARGFFDATTVAPRVSALSLDHLRFAAGVGIDFVTPSTELGRIAVAVSPEGTRLLLTFGVPKGFGDRQHRGD